MANASASPIYSLPQKYVLPLEKKETGQAIAANAPKPTVMIIVMTTSLEKIERDNAAARLKNLPVFFVSMREIEEFHSPEEILGNRVGHANVKMEEAINLAELIKASPLAEEAVKKLWTHYIDQPYDRQRIGFMVDDSSMGFNEPVWLGSKNDYARYLPDDILGKAEIDTAYHDGIKETMLGPSTELGPAAGAINIPELFEIALSNNPDQQKPVYALDAVTVMIKALNSTPVEPAETITKKCLNQVFTGVLPAAIQEKYILDSTTKHLCLPQFPDTPLIAMLGEYHTHYSPQAQVVDAIYHYMISLPYTAPSIDAQIKQAGKGATKPKNKPYVVRIMSGTLPDIPHTLKKGVTYNQTVETADADIASFLHVLDLVPNFNSHGAYVFAPEHRRKHEKRNFRVMRDTGYKFFAAGVEIQLTPSQANAPWIITDTNDAAYLSNRPFIDMYKQISPSMSKDHNQMPEYEQSTAPILNPQSVDIQKMTLISVGMFDYVRRTGPAEHPASLNLATNQVLARRRQEQPIYSGVPLAPPLQPIRSTGPYRDDIFKLLVITSAGSDNRILGEANSEIGADIARQGGGIVTGGMADHAGGAVLDGYNSVGGPWVELYSTPTIVKLEGAKGGMLPPGHFTQLTKNIFIREARLIKAGDMITATPGGIGTFKEVFAFMKLLDEAPELVKDKILNFHNLTLFRNAPPFWNKLLETCYGDKILRQMMHEGWALDGKLRMTTTVEQHHDLVAERMKVWEADRTAKLEAQAKAERRKCSRPIIVNTAANANRMPLPQPKVGS